MAKALVYGFMDPSSILAPFIDFLFSPLYSGNLSWKRVSGIPYGGKFSWGLIFVESPKRPSKLIFAVLNFVIANNPGAWHCCTSDDVIDTRARNLLCY